VASGALRQEEKARVTALLEAELALPRLVQHLSSGLIQVDSDTARRWAGWIRCLKRDPAWQILEPALTSPRSWPAVWSRAREAGFSPATEHHQAIFFTRLFTLAMATDHVEVPRWIWREALSSWRSVATANYLREVALAAMPDLLDEDCNTALEGLLDPAFQLLRERGLPALHLSNWNSTPHRRPLHFVLDAVAAVHEIFEGAPDSALVRGISNNADSLVEALSRAVTDEFSRRLEEHSLGSITRETILSEIDGALLRAQELGFPVKLDHALLRRSLALTWEIREIKREKELDLLNDTVTRLLPCADRILVAPEEDRFGMEGSIADLLVFAGEDALSLTLRINYFRRALEVCPGHRNASRLLSYALLEVANRELLKTSPLPSATARLGPLRRRVAPLLEEARRAVDEAAALYPDNDLLPRYQAELQEELTRFSIPEADDEME
jgi:hypothetical protein